MRIGIRDMDPQIAAWLQERFSAPMSDFLRDRIHWRGWLRFRVELESGGIKRIPLRDPTADERGVYQIEQRRRLRFALRTVAAVLAPLAAGSGAGVLAGLADGGGVGAAAGLLTCAVGGGLGAWWAAAASPRARRRALLQPDEMRAGIALLQLSPAERLYCDALLLLARIEVDPETETGLRSTLEQLNDLLVSVRKLEARRSSLVPALAANRVEQIESEFHELARQLDDTDDSVARQSIQQSLEMCESRLQNARAFEQGLGRLKAQEEALMQTLSSTQAALARLQLTPTTNASVAAEELAGRITDMNRQTASVEDAVEEVMELRR